jgi:DNA-binding NarL/FixJ family response regulator
MCGCRRPRTDEGIWLAQELRSSSPATGVVVLSQYAEPGYALDLFEGGAAGRAYLLKDSLAAVGQLAEAVRTGAADGTVVDPAMVDALVRRPAPADQRLARLTPGERDVLAEIAAGRSNRAIAQALVISGRAVEKHINSIFAKLELAGRPGLDHRVQAVLLFLAAGGNGGRPAPRRSSWHYDRAGDAGEDGQHGHPRPGRPGR